MDVTPLRYLNAPPDEQRFPDFAEFKRVWDGVRGERFAPKWRELGFLAFPVRLIPQMMLVDALNDPRDFRYRFIGTYYSELHGYDYTGHSIDDLKPAEFAKAAREQFEMICADPKPTHYFLQGSDSHGDPVTMVGIRLPLSDDGVTVNQLVSLSHHETDRKILEGYFCYYLTSDGSEGQSTFRPH